MSIHSDAGPQLLSREIAAYAAMIGGPVSTALPIIHVLRVTCAKDGHLAHMEHLTNGLSSLAPHSLSLFTAASGRCLVSSTTASHAIPGNVEKSNERNEGPPSRERSRLLRFSLVKSGPSSLMPLTSTKDERKESRVERPSLSISSWSKINLEYRVFIKSGEDRVAR